MKILKIGGSVITDKSEGAFEIALEDKIEEICSAIAENSEDLILVHGAGSFGHPHVKSFGISKPLSVARVHSGCLKLSKLFCEKLIEFGVPAIPVSPLTFFRVKNGIRGNLDLLNSILEKGLLPVLHGDVVVNERFGVLSGDDIAIFLAEKFNAELLGFATNVEGVFFNGQLVETLDRKTFEKIEWEKAGVDVTGGMKAKVEKVLRRVKCRTFIFKGTAENILKFLKGEKVGTEIIDRDLNC